VKGARRLAIQRAVASQRDQHPPRAKRHQPARRGKCVATPGHGQTGDRRGLGLVRGDDVHERQQFGRQRARRRRVQDDKPAGSVRDTDRVLIRTGGNLVLQQQDPRTAGARQGTIDQCSVACRVGAGDHHDGVRAICIDGDQRRSGGPRHRHDVRRADTAIAQSCGQCAAESILADAAGHGDPCAELCRGHRLVGALAAGGSEEILAEYRLALRRKPRAACHEIHIQAADHQDRPHWVRHRRLLSEPHRHHGSVRAGQCPSGNHARTMTSRIAAKRPWDAGRRMRG
jgi:hypothetical protein